METGITHYVRHIGNCLPWKPHYVRHIVFPRGNKETGITHYVRHIGNFLAWETPYVRHIVFPPKVLSKLGNVVGKTLSFANVLRRLQTRLGKLTMCGT